MVAEQADVDKKLYTAAQEGDIDAVKDLFSGTPTPNINSQHGPSCETALFAASLEGHLAVVEYLIDNGADVRAFNRNGHNTAHMVCWNYGSLDIISILAVLKLLFTRDRSMIDVPPRGSPTTCLHMAASQADAPMIQWLLDAGADATLKGYLDEPAWHSVIDKVFLAISLYSPRELDQVTQAYRAFIRHEMKSGNINEALSRLTYEKVRDFEVYQLSSANVVDLYILLEYLMYQKALRPACQQIRRELFSYVPSDGFLRFREPSCTLEVQSRQYDEHEDGFLGGSCNQRTYEDFKALISTADVRARPKATSFQVSKIDETQSKNKAGNRSSLPGDVDGVTISPSEGSRVARDGAETGQPMPDYLSLVMPIIAINSFRELEATRKDLVGNFKYRNDDAPDLQTFHTPLTIDEYCYPALGTKILERRNMDQTLARYSRTKFPVISKAPLSEKLVVVDQVWMWMIQDVLIYTSQGGVFEFESDAYPDAGSSRYAQIGHFVADLMDSGYPDAIFNSFQNSIVNLAEDVGGYTDRKGIESMTIEDEKLFYHNINDIREELSMIRRVLSQQEEVWRKFASNIWPDLWADCQDGRTRVLYDPQDKLNREDRRALMRLIMRPKLRIERWRQRISQLDEDAERVERSIAIQLDLKQKYASLQESHATAIMSTAVFGFTIITIIFTPLSFLMSLFALPIDRFQDSQVPSRWADDAGMYTTRYIGTWVGIAEVVSIIITIIAMWLALEYGLKYRVTLKIWNSLLDLNDKMYKMLKGLQQKFAPPKRKRLWSRRPRDEESMTSQSSSSTEGAGITRV